MTKVLSLTFVNLVTPKAGAKHELPFNKLSPGHKGGFDLCLTLKSDLSGTAKCDQNLISNFPKFDHT